MATGALPLYTLYTPPPHSFSLFLILFPSGLATMQAFLRPFASLSLLASIFGLVQAQSVLTAPGQPIRSGATLGAFELIGESLVSAQQLFLGTPDKVYFVDKVEGNPARINGHPAWASEWGLGSNSQRTMDAVTNSFCAGGNVLGNGTWLNVGGNQAVTYGGNTADSQNGGPPYDNPDGRRSLLDPCDDEHCDWILSPHETTGERWYPSLNGGYVNDAGQDNPTYEFFPPQGDAIPSPILQQTLPLLIQSNWATALLDYRTNTETRLDNIPDAVRVYPASAGTIMLPLTPANNYTATILFCGGSNIQPQRWTSPNFIIPTYGASTSCVKLTPDQSGTYQRDDPFPEARVMANFIALPNGKVLNLNGAAMGTAGYGNNTWAIGHSYADNPVLMPAIYDPNAPAGDRWSRDGLQPSTIPRMYHSSATLLADGSVLVSGSNPNPDYTVGPDVRYPTEYRTELFFPSYYNERRPQPKGLLSQLSYGGPTFDVTLDSDDLFGDVDNVQSAKVVVIRTGFSTHSMNMGQRYVELQISYTAFRGNHSAILHVSQLPPNPAILAPGPALIFVVVNDIPSVGLPFMAGSGHLGNQNIRTVASLPSPSTVDAPTETSSGSSPSSSSSSLSNGALSQVPVTPLLSLCLSGLVAFTLIIGS
ncbi:copper radical oxidase [Cyathus striatus]|nr:copper radical oxidase [Cyathus striatus]